MITATEMRAKAMVVNDKKRKEQQAEAIKWVESEAEKVICKAAEEGLTTTLISFPLFTGEQKDTVANHFRKHGYFTTFLDYTTLHVKW